MENAQRPIVKKLDEVDKALESLKGELSILKERISFFSLPSIKAKEGKEKPADVNLSPIEKRLDEFVDRITFLTEGVREMAEDVR